MNRFCLHKDLPEKVVRAMHMNVMTQSDRPENCTPYNIYLEIKQILKESKVFRVSPAWLLIPKGSIDEILAGLTESVKSEHRIFYFDFYATILTQESKRLEKEKIAKFSTYFSWVE